MQDAAGGFRDAWTFNAGLATCWPSLLAAAATWDVDTVREFAVALGEEFSGKGANAILGPSINVHRVARGGRNFEYLSGEDPYLGARLTEAYVEGVQSKGVAAVMKHWVFNNQETNRHTQSSNVDDRTAWEIYYPPFQAAVEAGVSAAMCSYNQIDGVPACGNEKHLSVLKDKMGFRGFVQSDWYATHSTSIKQGLDQEMPGTGKFFSPKALAKVNASLIDASVRRILAVMYRMDLFNSTKTSAPAKDFLMKDVRSESHKMLARKTATESVVLLKKD
jgi:beta-glucosidase